LSTTTTLPAYAGWTTNHSAATSVRMVFPILVRCC
jgi:hypothetical protein